MRRIIAALLATFAAVTITAVAAGPASAADGTNGGPIMCCR
jgi:hypothetical protein